MFMIYEEIFRYIGGCSSFTELGYVKTKDEALAICEKLNNRVKGKNEVNTMASWRYYFEEIKEFDMDYFF